MALIRALSPLESPEKVFHRVVNDPENFNRVYELLVPRDVVEVVFQEDALGFLLCGDLDFFREWLGKRILQRDYTCVETPFETPF